MTNKTFIGVCIAIIFAGVIEIRSLQQKFAVAELKRIMTANGEQIKQLGDEIIAVAERLERIEGKLKLIGKASWYGNFENGWPTANGEIFSKYALTAAAVDLPFNSVWQVRRLDTGHSVEVRINDRLPSKHGRILDLSEAAAIALDMRRVGVCRVMMEPVLRVGIGD